MEVGDACWKQGEPAVYLHVAQALEAVISTSKRLLICNCLTNMFRSVLALAPENLLETAYLACGKLSPDYLGQELNVGGSLVSSAISSATASSRSKMRSLYAEMGDLGDVAQVHVLLTPNCFTPYFGLSARLRSVFDHFRHVVNLSRDLRSHLP